MGRRGYRCHTIDSFQKNYVLHNIVPVPLLNNFSTLLTSGFFLGLHDLDSVEGRNLEYTQEKIDLDSLLMATTRSPAGSLETESASALRQRLVKEARGSQPWRHHLQELEDVCCLRDEDKVLSMEPLGSSEATRPCEDEESTHILVVAAATCREIGKVTF